MMKRAQNYHDTDETEKGNSTVVCKPVVFTDHFREEKEGIRPSHWLEKNTESVWKTKQIGDKMVYGCAEPDTLSASWLHVFETNVEITADLYVNSTGTSENAKAGLVIRLSGTGVPT